MLSLAFAILSGVCLCVCGGVMVMIPHNPTAEQLNLALYSLIAGVVLGTAAIWVH